MELCKFILFLPQMDILIFETWLKIEAKFQVTLLQSAVLNHYKEHYRSGLWSIWMNDKQKICTFKMILSQISQIFQRIQKPGLALVCWVEVSVSKSQNTSHLCLLSSRQTSSEKSLGCYWGHRSWILSISKKVLALFSHTWEKICNQRKN